MSQSRVAREEATSTAHRTTLGGSRGATQHLKSRTSALRYTPELWLLDSEPLPVPADWRLRAFG